MNLYALTAIIFFALGVMFALGNMAVIFHWKTWQVSLLGAFVGVVSLIFAGWIKR